MKILQITFMQSTRLAGCTYTAVHRIPSSLSCNRRGWQGVRILQYIEFLHHYHAIDVVGRVYVYCSTSSSFITIMQSTWLAGCTYTAVHRVPSSLSCNRRGRQGVRILQYIEFLHHYHAIDVVGRVYVYCSTSSSFITIMQSTWSAGCTYTAVHQVPSSLSCNRRGRQGVRILQYIEFLHHYHAIDVVGRVYVYCSTSSSFITIMQSTWLAGCTYTAVHRVPSSLSCNRRGWQGVRILQYIEFLHHYHAIDVVGRVYVYCSTSSSFITIMQSTRSAGCTYTAVHQVPSSLSCNRRGWQGVRILQYIEFLHHYHAIDVVGRVYVYCSTSSSFITFMQSTWLAGCTYTAVHRVPSSLSCNPHGRQGVRILQYIKFLHHYHAIDVVGRVYVYCSTSSSFITIMQSTRSAGCTYTAVHRVPSSLSCNPRGWQGVRILQYIEFLHHYHAIHVVGRVYVYCSTSSSFITIMQSTWLAGCTYTAVHRVPSSLSCNRRGRQGVRILQYIEFLHHYHAIHVVGRVYVYCSTSSSFITIMQSTWSAGCTYTAVHRVPSSLSCNRRGRQGVRILQYIEFLHHYHAIDVVGRVYIYCSTSSSFITIMQSTWSAGCTYTAVHRVPSSLSCNRRGRQGVHILQYIEFLHHYHAIDVVGRVYVYCSTSSSFITFMQSTWLAGCTYTAVHRVPSSLSCNRRGRQGVRILQYIEFLHHYHAIHVVGRVYVYCSTSSSFITIMQSTWLAGCTYTAVHRVPSSLSCNRRGWQGVRILQYIEFLHHYHAIDVVGRVYVYCSTSSSFITIMQSTRLAGCTYTAEI